MLPDEKAIALCWMLHLVGDIHQPLHCSTLYSADRFTMGDRGGNSFSVSKPDSDTHTNLHSLWDGAFGTSETTKVIHQIAGSAMEAHPRGEFGSSIGSLADLSSWIHASATEAKQIAYGTLASTSTFPVELSSDYMDKMEAHAQKKIALAGYRLASILNAWAAGGTDGHVDSQQNVNKQAILAKIDALEQQIAELRALVLQLR